ncbi:MAG: M48 family metallopeptidase [Pseudomonadota bacterium]|nr:M48 family metallopeptidase [Pseudomonadota bacterium]
MINLLAFLIIAYITLKVLLDIYQIYYIKNANASDADLKLFSIDIDYFKRSNSYNISKLFLSIINVLITGIILSYFVLLGGIQDFNNNIEKLNISYVNQELAIVIFFVVFMSVINMPIGLYKTFYIEEKFGFNKSSLSLYIKDSLLSLILGVVIASILFSALNILFISYPDYWWFYIWLVYILFNIFILYAYPIFIAPLFNEFKKLSDKSIIEVVNSLSKKTNFSVSNIYVMDGSKRSAHSNAYFTGFHKSKRIVFFDTLLSMLTPNEIEAVLAHEIGHYKKNHILKSMLMSLVFSFLAFYFMYNITLIDSFFYELNINPSSPGQLIIFFSLILPSVLFFLNPFFSSLSRKNEFEADNYAKDFSNKDDLISSLKKLYKENLTILKTSPLYSSIYNSHPTVFERINNLKS